MSLDGRFLYYLANELNQDLQNGRIQKIYQLTKTDFLFLIRANSKNLQLTISLSTSISRIHLTNYHTDKPDNPSGFCMLLRKYIEGGIVLSVSTLSSDRIVNLHLQNINEMGETKTYNLYMEMMGRYANLIVCDEENKIIDAFKHISPFEDQERTILKGITYHAPEDGKINPFDAQMASNYLTSLDDYTYQDLIAHFTGFSPLLSKHLISQAKIDRTSLLISYQKMMEEKVHPTLFIKNNIRKFYYFDVFPEGEKLTFKSLSLLLDEYYSETSKMERMKQVSKNIYQLAKREFEKNKNKLEKLTKELDVATNSEIIRIKGDLIIQNMNQIARGDLNLTTFDYENNQEISIELDRLLTPIQNANMYYKKYKKNKTAVSFIQEQILLTKKQITYFDLLISQIENAQMNDLDEIHEELAKLGFLRTKIKKQKIKKPNYDTYQDKDNVIIYVGKNNIQNEYLTHKIAKSNEWWFHTKDNHGSHVIVSKSGELSETTIRTAALLAAYFSKARMSSSVPVDYTLVKFVKKIPGEMGSLVQYTNHKTIYIDPDSGVFNQIKVIKNQSGK